MNQLEAKQKKTLMALAEADGFLTLESLAFKAGVSKRSVQNHIESIELWLKENGLGEATLIRKPGLGIRLLLPEEKRRHVHSALERANPFQDDAARQRDILKTLVFANEEYTIGYFADHYYVSRATILKDLEWIERWLARFHLALYRVQCRGLGIQGNELSKRNAIAAFVELFEPQEGEQEESRICSGRISREKYDRLRTLYPKLDIAAVAAIIEQTESAFEFFLTGDFFTSLLAHLTICIARELSGNDDAAQWPEEIHAQEPEISAAAYIASKIYESFGLELPPSERAYICLHLMSYNMSYMLDDGAKSLRQKGLEPLAAGIIEHFEAKTGIPLSRDKTLYTGLLLHLNTTVYRMKGNIYVRPAQIDMTDVDADLYGAARELTGLYEAACGFEPSEEELLALAVHFMLARKRSQKKKQALFVSNAGVAAGYALCKAALADMQGVEIVDVVSSKVQLSTILEPQYDLIISTVSVEDATKPVVNLAQVAQSEYKQFISEFIQTL